MDGEKDVMLTFQLPYGKLLQEFPFKGAEQSLKALEEHELVSFSYHEGRPSRVRPGKPVFRYAFEALVEGESRLRRIWTEAWTDFTRPCVPCHIAD